MDLPYPDDAGHLRTEARNAVSVRLDRLYTGELMVANPLEPEGVESSEPLLW
jgi:hypothetical protein